MLTPKCCNLGVHQIKHQQKLCPISIQYQSMLIASNKYFIRRVSVKLVDVIEKFAICSIFLFIQ